MKSPLSLSRLAPPAYRRKIHPSRASFHMGAPPFPQNPSPSKRAKLGLRYEEKVHEEFEQRYGGLYLPGQWLSYQEERKRPHFCQPDGLLFLPEGRIIVLEIKHSHVLTAFFQLQNLYIPVLSFLFPLWELIPCEVVRWYDPDVLFPVSPRLCAEPLRAIKDAFNVHIWSPGGR